jgi:hypothetical protein
LSASVAFGYWLGYQHGSSLTSPKLHGVKSLRQVGLGFRQHQNDITRFTATGVVAAPQMQPQER